MPAEMLPVLNNTQSVVVVCRQQSTDQSITRHTRQVRVSQVLQRQLGFHSNVAPRHFPRSFNNAVPGNCVYNNVFIGLCARTLGTKT